METDRLTTLDEYGGRRFVIPAEVTGPLRKWRSRVYFVLIFIFLALPWIKINGVPMLMLDVGGRRFAIAGQMFYAHDGPLVFFILGGAAMALAFATAVYGRVWCGWACPQTVFIDAVYRRIEIWIEGNYIERRRLIRSGPTGQRLRLAMSKWSLYFIVSSIIAHSFIAFFTGGDRLLAMIKGPPSENWVYFVMVTFVTGLFMFNFGWFREQFCTIMCPYGRFQSVLMDQDSVTVRYDEKRNGDCVQCNRCVEVCPAKIDIRKGMQMECIACTACIDACNVIMRKVHKPEGLIGYGSMSGRKRWSARAYVYLALHVVCAISFTVAWLRHQPIEATVLRGKDTPYQLLGDGQIVNHFKVHLFNQSAKKMRVRILARDERIHLTQAVSEIELRPGQDLEQHVFAAFPAEVLNARGEAQTEFEIEGATPEPLRRTTVLIGPLPGQPQQPGANP